MGHPTGVKLGRMWCGSGNSNIDLFFSQQQLIGSLARRWGELTGLILGNDPHAHGSPSLLSLGVSNFGSGPN